MHRGREGAGTLLRELARRHVNTQAVLAGWTVYGLGGPNGVGARVRGERQGGCVRDHTRAIDRPVPLVEHRPCPEWLRRKAPLATPARLAPVSATQTDSIFPLPAITHCGQVSSDVNVESAIAMPTAPRNTVRHAIFMRLAEGSDVPEMEADSTTEGIGRETELHGGKDSILPGNASRKQVKDGTDRTDCPARFFFILGRNGLELAQTRPDPCCRECGRMTGRREGEIARHARDAG